MDPDIECSENYPQPNKKRKVRFDENDESTTEVHNTVFHNNCSEATTSQGRSNGIERSFLVRDTNNNRNKNRDDVSQLNSFSKSFTENPQKGKSIKRRSTITHHVSFEGSQAPEVLSVRITSPRQLHMTASLSSWNQPSTSQLQGSKSFLNEEGRLDDNTLEEDFQRLSEVQRLYPNYRIQSTPRNDVTMTCSQNTVYSPRITPNILYD